MTIEIDEEEAIFLVATIHNHLKTTPKQFTSYLIASMLLQKLRPEILGDEKLRSLVRKLVSTQPI